MRRKNNIKRFWAKRRNRQIVIFTSILVVVLLLGLIFFSRNKPQEESLKNNIGPKTRSFSQEQGSQSTALSTPDSIPDYEGSDYIELNNNVPNFTEYDLAHISGEEYSELDYLGRCGPAIAMLDRSMMPTEERGEIGNINLKVVQ